MKRSFYAVMTFLQLLDRDYTVRGLYPLKQIVDPAALVQPKVKNRTRIVLLAALCAGNLYFENGQFMLTEQIEHLIQAILIHVFHIQVNLRHIVQNAVFDAGKDQFRKQHQKGCIK